MNKMNNLYKPIEVKVERIINESPGIKSFLLKPKSPPLYSFPRFR